MSDFLILDSLLRSRIRLSIPVARRMLLAGMVALSSVGLLTGAVFAAGLGALGEREVAFGTALLCAGALLSFVVVTAEWAIGPKRLVVSRSAHRGLFRAVDAPALDLLVCTVSLRTMPIFAVWQFVAFGWAVGVGNRVSGVLLALVVVAPCATFVAHVAIVAVSGAAGPRPAVAASLLAALLVVMVIPASTGLRSLVRGDFNTYDFDAERAVLTWVAAGAVLIVIFALGASAIRRIARAPFPVLGASLWASRTVGVERALVRQSGRAQWTGIVSGALSFALVGLVSALVVRLAGIDPRGWLSMPLPDPTGGVKAVGVGWMPATPLELVRQVSVAVVASVGFVVMESSLAFIGPGRARAHLRFAYETGASLSRLVFSALVINTANMAVLGLIVAVAYITMTADAAGGTTVVASSLVVAAAALMADAVVPAVRRPDGSSERTIATALVSTGGAAPFLALAARTEDDVAVGGSCVGAIVLLGGAAWALSRHLQRRSS